MRINTNIASMTAQENAANVNKNLSSSLEKLSSGLRINKAADDASGMSIADKLRTQASSLGQSISNANSANALVQIADKAMGEQSNILDIVKTKLIQAATQTTSDEGREAIRKDVSKLLEQLDNISNQTNYNGINLLDAKGAEFSFQVGEKASYDISSTTAYAVNTDGLGGGAATIASDSTIDAQDSKALSSDGTIVLTGTDKDAGFAALSTEISGKVGTIEAHNGDVTITLTDGDRTESAATLATIAEKVGAVDDTDKLALSADGFTLTIKAGNSIDLSGVDFSNVTVSTTAGASVLINTAADTDIFTVKNANAADSTDTVNIDLKGTIDTETTSAVTDPASATAVGKLSILVGDTVYVSTANTTFSTATGGSVISAMNSLASQINDDATGVYATFDTATNKITLTGTADGSSEIIAYDIEPGTLVENDFLGVTTVLGTGGSLLEATTAAVNTTNTVIGGDLLNSLKNLEENGLTSDIANNYMEAVDAALNQINTVRSDFGSTQNQLDSFIRNAMTTQTNIKAAESVIRDVDYAAESANFNKQNIIAQAGTYAMSQANAVQQNVMRLLQ